MSVASTVTTDVDDRGPVQAARGRRREAEVSDSSGFTLIELLVGMVLGLAVLTAAMTLLISGVHDQGSLQARTYQLDQAQAAMQQVVRELREASNVTLTGTNKISFSEPVATGLQTISFACTSGTCTNTVGGVTQTVIPHVINSNIFTAWPNSTSPAYIGITLTVAATGQTPVTLTDGAGLRNVTLGS